MPHFEQSPGPNLAAQCESVLRALPDWFGLEHAILEYTQQIADFPTWYKRESDGSLSGFLTIQQHFPGAAEILVMAVSPTHHRRGLGSELLHACESSLAAEGCQFLQVKTVSASSADTSYAKTRAFYTAMGFQPLQEFPDLWDAHNPCLVMIKSLSRK